MADNKRKPETRQNSMHNTLLYIFGMLTLIPGAFYMGVVVTWFFPVPHGYNQVTWRFLVGALAVLILREAFNLAGVIYDYTKALIRNRQLKHLAIASVPQTDKEFAYLEIDTPLDFCFAVLMKYFYTPLDIYEEPMPPVMLRDEKLFLKLLESFKEIYGRNPHGSGTANWVVITMCEAAAEVETDIWVVTFAEIVDIVSPNVRKWVYEQGDAEWADAVRSMLDKASEKYRERRRGPVDR